MRPRGARRPALAADTDQNVNATATSAVSRIDRSRPQGEVAEPASGGAFTSLWAALRDAPAREPRRRADPSDAPVMVSAAAMNTATVRIGPDPLTDALLAFKRHSSVTFANAVAASVYAADPAERGAPAARVPGGA
jgi:hypothetical protein